MLIGMDVLTCGDFALTHQGGKTVASFRVPSLVTYDFIRQVNTANQFAEAQAKRTANASKKKKKRR